MIHKTDYLVKGCGASAMSFIDVMLRESDATITVVDRRAAPGGHWNDAYPFVRLHQPSTCYGVSSRKLGRDTIDKTGLNAGLNELASGIEVADYFHQVMRDTFLPSGRVSYFPVSEVAGENEIVHLLSGERRTVEVRKKHVDATRLHTSVPLTHTRQYEVADRVVCIPPNHLTRLAPEHKRYTVLGAGKTAIDSVLWLLSAGAPPEAISWVLPRDPWLLNRASFQPGDQFVKPTMAGVANQYEICATAQSIAEVCERMESAGQWLRLDPTVWPTMFHGATVTEAELARLREVRNVIRLGRVKRIEAERIVLTEGEAACEPGALYIDCTARALTTAFDDGTPVFSPSRIALHMIRQYQPTFSAALIAHLEATEPDEDRKRAFTTVTPFTDTVENWLSSTIASMGNQFTWMRDDALRAWIAANRLDMMTDAVGRMSQTDGELTAIQEKARTYAGAAIKNMRQLLDAAAA